MIDFVTLSNLESFNGNPIVEQHRLRYRSVIERQKWSVPHYQGLEYDEYDNPVAKYLVCRNTEGKAVGCSRFYPTHLPYMLEEKFSKYVSQISMPKDENIWEGSRLCIDNTIPPSDRKKVIQSIVVSYLEMGISNNINAIVGLMYPACWESVFIKSGWDIEFIGDALKLPDGHKAQAAWLPVNTSILEKVRETTRIYQQVTNFGVTHDVKKQRKAIEAVQPTPKSIRSALQYLIEEARVMNEMRHADVLEKALNSLEDDPSSKPELAYNEKDWNSVIQLFRILSKSSPQQIRDFIYIVECLEQDS